MSVCFRCGMFGAYLLIWMVLASPEADTQIVGSLRSDTNNSAARNASPPQSERDGDYSFQMLLDGNPRAIAGAEKRFTALTDPARKMRIASILISRGVEAPVYHNYLVKEAEKALASPVPWPIDENLNVTDHEARVVRLFPKSGSIATLDELAAVAKESHAGLSHKAIDGDLQALRKKGYVRQITTNGKITYQCLIAITNADINYIQAYTLKPSFLTWCREHPEKPCDEWYQIVVYPNPDAWYFLAAAADARAYNLLISGLHSDNVGIAILAAKGLAKLQDPRSIEEIAVVARRQGYEAKVSMGECLLYFPETTAQQAAEEILDDKRVGNQRILEARRAEVKANGVKNLFPW